MARFRYPADKKGRLVIVKLPEEAFKEHDKTFFNVQAQVAQGTRFPVDEKPDLVNNRVTFPDADGNAVTYVDHRETYTVNQVEALKNAMGDTLVKEEVEKANGEKDTYMVGIVKTDIFKGGQKGTMVMNTKTLKDCGYNAETKEALIKEHLETVAKAKAERKAQYEADMAKEADGTEASAPEVAEPAKKGRKSAKGATKVQEGAQMEAGQ